MNSAKYLSARISLLMHPRLWLLGMAVLSMGFVSFALYLQHVDYVLPCPLCVLQRYAFLGIAFFTLIGALTAYRRLGALFALLSAIGGGIASVAQLLAMRTPSIECGRDPLEATVNGLFPAQWLPSVFRSEGLCNEPLDAILGLTPPEWTLFWYVVFAIALYIVMLQRQRAF